MGVRLFLANALARFVCGANRDGFHYRGVNWERDLATDPARVADIRNVSPGDQAPGGQGELRFLRGICWPPSSAPFDVHIVALNYDKSPAVGQTADELLARCAQAGFDALLDDRDERPGVKFADADLLGLPHRITVGERGLRNGQVEYRARRGGETVAVAPQAIAEMPWFAANRADAS